MLKQNKQFLSLCTFFSLVYNGYCDSYWNYFCCILHSLLCPLRMFTVHYLFTKFQVILLHWGLNILKFCTWVVCHYCALCSSSKELFWGKTTSFINHSSKRFLWYCFEFLSPVYNGYCSDRVLVCFFETSEGKVWFWCNITRCWAESIVLTWKFEVCEDVCAVMQLCLEFGEMEHSLKKCVVAIKKTCNINLAVRTTTEAMLLQKMNLLTKPNQNSSMLW